jgi:hypothetical protein
VSSPQRRPAVSLQKAPDQHPARGHAPEPAAPPPPAPVQQPPADPLVNYSARIPHSVRVRLNTFCARTERRSQSVVTEALMEWLDRNDA